MSARRLGERLRGADKFVVLMLVIAGVVSLLVLGYGLRSDSPGKTSGPKTTSKTTPTPTPVFSPRPRSPAPVSTVTRHGPEKTKVVIVRGGKTIIERPGPTRTVTRKPTPRKTPSKSPSPSPSTSHTPEPKPTPCLVRVAGGCVL